MSTESMSYDWTAVRRPSIPGGETRIAFLASSRAVHWCVAGSCIRGGRMLVGWLTGWIVVCITWEAVGGEGEVPGRMLTGRVHALVRKRWGEKASA